MIARRFKVTNGPYAGLLMDDPVDQTEDGYVFKHPYTEKDELIICISPKYIEEVAIYLH